MLPGELHSKYYLHKMRNKYLKLLTIFGVIILVGCRPVRPSPGHTHERAEGWTHDTNTHWHNCTADDGYKFDEAAHTYVDSVVDPTYETQGYTLHTCSVCGYSYKDNYTNPLEHNYSSSWSHSDTEHWRYCIDAGYEQERGYVGSHTYVDVVIPPTPNESGYTEHTCSVCGFSYRDSYVDPTSEHHYSEEWDHDETNHWHNCTDDGCEAKSGVAAHTMNETSRVDATYDVAGYVIYTCSVCGYFYQEDLPQLVHHYSSEWSHDDNSHWHYCTDEGFETLKGDEAAHSYGDAVFTEQVDLSTYKKGYNTYTCVCGFSYTEDVYYTKDEMCSLMNDYIEGKSYEDVFKVKDDLLSLNYPLIDNLSSANYFAYDLEEDAIVVMNDESLTSRYVPYREKIVSSAEALREELSAIEYGASYSMLKLDSDLTIDSSLIISTVKPLEINLNGHTIDYTAETEGAIRIVRGNGLPSVVIKEGTIRTKVIEGMDISKSPDCIKVVEADYLRLSSVNLVNRAERGYGYIDYPNKKSAANVLVEDCTISSPIVAVCIQTNHNLFKGNTVTGVTVINGGTSSLLNNTFDASLVQKGLDREATELVSNYELATAANGVYSEASQDTFMVTSTDAIIIYDRRSPLSTYSNPVVNIENNVLKCKVGDNDVPFGYGIRYLDLNIDPLLGMNSFDKSYIKIEENTYTYCQGAPYQAPGGYYIYEAE